MPKIVELPDLDPGGKEALKYLNRRWWEGYRSWDEFDRDQLIYWLRQALLELRLIEEEGGEAK